MMWSRGRTFRTNQTRKWSKEEWDRNEQVEKWMLFENFSIFDEGRSRVLVCSVNPNQPNAERKLSMISLVEDMYDLLSSNFVEMNDDGLEIWQGILERIEGNE